MPKINRVFAFGLMACLVAPVAWAWEAPSAPESLPGIWREFEKGEGHTRGQKWKQASGGALVGWIDKGKKTHLTFEVSKPLSRARLYLHYNNGMQADGTARVLAMDPEGKQRDLGLLEEPRTGRWDNFAWISLFVGPMAAGTWRITFAHPGDGPAPGGHDVAVLVDDEWDGLWVPPSFKDGKPIGTGHIRPPVSMEVKLVADSFATRPGKPVQAEVSLRNYSAVPQTASLRWEIIARDDSPPSQADSYAFELDANEVKKQTLTLANGLTPGWYAIHFSPSMGTPFDRHVLCSAVDKSALVKEKGLWIAGDRWLGMNRGHGGDDNQVLADFKEVGLRSIRTGTNNADPAASAPLVKRLVAADLDVHWVINYRGNGIDPKGTSVKEIGKLNLHGPVMQQWYETYKARCVAYMKYFSSPGQTAIRHYICGNEPDKKDNHTGLPGRPDVATLLTRAMYEAAQEVNPGEIYVESPPVAQPDTEYLRDMIVKHKVYEVCDIIGTHVYGNQTLDHRIRKPWEYLAEVKATCQVACSEAGVSTGWTPKGMDKRAWQADFMAHWYMKLKRMGYCHGIMFTHDEDHHSDWAQMRDKGEKLQPTWDLIAHSLTQPTGLVNGGFEQPNNRRAMWVPDYDLDIPGGVPDRFDWQATDNVHEGKHAARLNSSAENGAVAYQVVEKGVIPGKAVIVKAMIASTGVPARISLGGYDPVDGDACTFSDAVTSDAWTAVELRITPTNPWVVIGLHAAKSEQENAHAWFDGVTLRQE